MGTELPLPQKRGHRPPIFGPCLFWQTAGWIKMPLGTEVGLGKGNFVLAGDLAPPKRGTAPPHFRSMSIVAKWLDGSRCHLVWRYTSTQATSCYMGTLLALNQKGGGDVRWDPAPLPQKGAEPPSNLRLMFIVAKGLDGSRLHLVWK